MLFFIASRFFESFRVNNLRSFRDNHPVGQGLWASASYFTSRHCLLTFLVLFLVHRIQHIVIPRRPTRLNFFQHAAIRIPPIILLGRVILMTLAMASLSGGPFHALNIKTINIAKTYDLDANSTTYVMWSMLIAFAVATISENFARALNNEMPFISSSNNIHSLSGLAYFYSQPPESFGDFTPSAYVYLFLAFSAFEMAILHLMVLFRAERFRFFVTGICTLTLQLSLNYVQYYSLDVSDAGLRMLERLPELILSIISFITISIHAIAQIILEGRLTWQIFGHSSNLPDPREDFLLGIMKYAVNCLESTRLGGLDNELKGVSTPAYTYIDLSRHASIATTSIESTSGRLPSSEVGSQGALAAMNGGVLSHPVAGIRVHSANNRADGTAPGRDIIRGGFFSPPFSASTKERAAAYRLLVSLYKFGRALIKLIFHKLLCIVGIRSDSERTTQGDRSDMLSSLPASVTIEDDDPDDASYTETSDEEESVDDGGDYKDDENDEDDVDEREVSDLYSDMTMPQQQQQENTSLFDPSKIKEMMSIYMAHTDQQQSPATTTTSKSSMLKHRKVTRQTFKKMQDASLSVSPIASSSAMELYSATFASPSTQPSLLLDKNTEDITSQFSPLHSTLKTRTSTRATTSATKAFDQHLVDLINERRPLQIPQLDPEDVDRNMCIVCRCEPRTVLTFPCCCLTMCDSCRENLASRQGSSQQRCIACRRSIEGYSRVWIP